MLWLVLKGQVIAAPTVSTIAQSYAPDHVLIQFRPEVGQFLVGATRSERLANLRHQLGLPAGARLEESKLSRKLRRDRRGKPGWAEDEPMPDLQRFCYLYLPETLKVPECVRRLENHPWVEVVEPDGIGRGGAIPNDPDFSLQWNHRNTVHPGADIATPLAWDMTTGSADVVVAVLDSGLNRALPEFEGRVMPGYDFHNLDDDPDDDNGHGTAVAGVLCASGDNGTLVAGVDWQCRIMPLKVLDEDNVGRYSDWAEAVDFAVSNGCKVINLSAGGSGSSTLLTRAITNAVAQGVIFVTITHNFSRDTITFPGNLPESITVGATNEEDRRTAFSNYGPEIDLVAPGTNIWTVSLTGTPSRWWGTSFAAPQVAGVCSLIAASRPDLTQEQARTLLCLGAEDEVGDPTDTPGFDIYYGWGRLNAYHSLLLAAAHIDSIQATGTALELAWPSPTNSRMKTPYRVEAKSMADAKWVDVTGTGDFEYGPNQTRWNVKAGLNTNQVQVLRLRLRDL